MWLTLSLVKWEGGENVGRARSVSFASKEGVALGLVG